MFLCGPDRVRATFVTKKVVHRCANLHLHYPGHFLYEAELFGTSYYLRVSKHSPSWLYINYQRDHWLLFIHIILFSSTCFEPQVLIFRRIQLYTCSIWYCHSLWEFLVACRYKAWVRTDCRGKVVGRCLKTPTNNLPPTVSSHSSFVPTGHQELS